LFSQLTGNGLIVTFNPVTGAILKEMLAGGLDLGYKVTQAQLVYDYPDEDFLKGIIMLDPSSKVSSSCFTALAKASLHPM
jgi:hypothetical protein